MRYFGQLFFAITDVKVFGNPSKKICAVLKVCAENHLLFKDMFGLKS